MDSRWILVCLCLVTVFDLSRGKSVKIPVQRIEVDHSSNKTLLNDVFVQPLKNRRNLQYRGLISVGKPSQVMTVVFDTGSSILWIPRKGCRSSGPLAVACKSNQGVYNPKKSETSELTDQRFRKRYGTGSAEGRLVYEYVAFGNPETEQLKMKEKVLIGVADEMKFLDEGILGMSAKPGAGGSSLIHEALNQGLLDRPVFTTFLKRCPPKIHTCRDGGQIVIGDVDNENCEAVESWVNVSRHSRHWTFYVDSASMGSAHVGRTQKVISDSGTSVIVLPHKYAQRLAEGVGARLLHSEYFVPCDKEFSLDLEIEDHTYQIAAKHMLLDRGNGECELALTGDDHDTWILGDPAYCQVHDVKEKRIGFAKAKDVPDAEE